MLTKESYQPKDGRFVQFFARDEKLNCGCYGGNYGVYSPNTSTLPFVFSVNLQNIQAFPVSIYNDETGKRLICLSSADIPHELYKMPDGTHRFVYLGGKIPDLQLPDNTRYYIEMLGFRSCPIIAKINLSCYTKVTLGNTNELFGLPYQRGFLQWVWLDIEFEKFRHDRFTLESKDDLGRVTVEQVRLEKIWTFDLYDAPGNIYQTILTASICDTVIFTKGEKEVKARRKRSAATQDKNAITCESDVTIEVPEAEAEVNDGKCQTTDDWEDVDNETGAGNCNANIWIDTGRFRCVPVESVSGCDPKPRFKVTHECIDNAGRIIITPENVPPGQDVEYSINNGSSYSRTGIFSSLASGTYKTLIRYVGTLCISNVTPINITCGDDETLWRPSGISVCVEETDSIVEWQPSGRIYCTLQDSDAYLIDEIPEYPNDITI